VDAELAEDVLDVRADRSGTDHELIGDFSGALPLGEEREDLSLPSRQHRQLERRAALLRLAARPQRTPNARDQLVQVDRLDEVVVGSEK
jgi:hypothetical protein